MANIYVYAAHADRPLAAALVQALIASNHADRVLLNPHPAQPTAVDQAVRYADVLIFVVSNNLINDPVAQHAFITAEQHQTFMIHAVIAPDRLAYFQANHPHTVDLTHGIGDLRALYALLPQSTPPAAPALPVVPNLNIDVGRDVNAEYANIGGTQTINREEYHDNARRIDLHGGSYTERYEHHEHREGRSRYVVIPSVLMVLVLVSVLAYWQRPKNIPAITYEFLLDTSDHMLQPLNGVPRREIAYDTIKSIANDTVSLQLESAVGGLRVAGGDRDLDGDGEVSLCQETTQLIQQRALNTQTLTPILNDIQWGGHNALRAGAQAVITDFAPIDSDLKLVFLLLGSVQIDEDCGEAFDFQQSLDDMALSGINSTMCIFTLLDEDQQQAFDQFRADLLEAYGISCVYNGDDADDFNRIAMRKIQHEVERWQEQSATLSPPEAATAMIEYLTVPPATAAVALAPSTTPSPPEAATAMIEYLTVPPATAAVALAPSTTPASGANWTPVEQTVDSVMMVQVPAGCFTMGTDDGEDDEQPPHEQCLDGFWIDRTETTRAQYQACVDAGACERVLENSFSNDPQQPANRLTWFDAQAYCAWRGARLPTEAEWEYAARGSGNRMYPWGDQWNADYANWRDTTPNRTFEVGSFPAGASWVGVLDMSGNLWEWTSSPYALYPYDPAAVGDGTPNTSYVLRGGSFVNIAAHLRVTNRNTWQPNVAFNYSGVRCARSDVP